MVPNLSFSVDKVEIQVLEGKDYSGSFAITCENHVKVKGLVYSSIARMECCTPQFEGEESRIRYQFHSEGLEEGDVLEGAFYIVCEQKEYTLPFCVSVTKLYAEATTGAIQNLYEFTNLAKNNWREAYQLFYSSNFRNIISDNEVQESLVYQGIIQARPSDQNLEEFLIGIRKKKRIHFSVEKYYYFFDCVTEAQKEAIPIQKDEWGFGEINISSDSPFIIPGKTRITTEDFIGSNFLLEYMIRPTYMHSGKNYGRLILSGVYQEIIIEICAMADKLVQAEKPPVEMQVKECKVGVMELYQAYRLKRIVTGVWANETIDILKHLHALEPENSMYTLMQAQAYVINRQRQDAEWILDEYKRNCTNRRTPEWGYYLYVMTLLEREPSYVDKMTHEIEQIFHENPDSVLLFWILTFLLDEYYNNSARKWKAIEYWATKGCFSPYLYVEAYYLIWQDPYLLSKLDVFEIRLLRWAIKHQALTKDLANQIFEVAAKTGEYSNVILDLLTDAYLICSSPENLGFICSYLIKGQKYDTQYHEWYQRGIELELRITGLYEAFLVSMDPHEVTTIPHIIQMYFQYESKLPYKKMAVLYNNIIAAKKAEPEVYQKYRKVMGKFAMEQAEAEHIDDNLAILYDDMLDLGLVNREIAQGLSRILFTYKISVFDTRVVRVLVYEKQLKNPQIVPIVNQEAYFSLCTNDYVILFEDAKGHRFAGSIQYQLQQLLNPEKYLSKCIQLAPAETSYVVRYFNTKQSYLTFETEDEKFFPVILYGTEFSVDFVRRLVPEILHYYQVKGKMSEMEQYLLQVDFSIFPAKTRRTFINYLAELRLYDSLLALATTYGIDQLGASAQVLLASYLLEKHGEEKDEFLLQLIETAYFSGKFNEAMLHYMAIHYNGSTEHMIEVWKSLNAYEISNYDYEERLLSQMIYAQQVGEYSDELYFSYAKLGGKDMVLLAYLSVRAHAYFVKQEVMSIHLLKEIEERYIHKMELNDACKLALFKYLADKEEISTTQFAIEEELLAEYTCKNMNFAFYKQLDRSLILKYHLYDKVFLEYRTEPDKHVVLHYSRDAEEDSFVTEDMLNVYDGIFIKQFTMFFGDVIQYYISEEKALQVEVTESNRITHNDVCGEREESRYNLLNQMIISQTLSDTEMLYHNMKQYEGLHQVSERVFKLL